jgi:hypothetical protein
MTARLDELRRDGVALAETAEGMLLPLIDVGHPRFTVCDDEATLRRLRREVEADERRHDLLPRFLLAWMLRRAARTSRFVRAMTEPQSTYLDGISTYAMKLGAANLVPPFDGEIDERFAASPRATVLRLRMQQMAGLLADAAQRQERLAPGRPLHVINIAGGPAMDAINAVLLLSRRTPGALGGAIKIHVLDREESGAAFGQAALAALQSGGPLAGVAVEMRWQPYDWNETALLERLVGDISAEGGVIIAASEGGLFEYGSDAAILNNLRVLASGGRGAGAVVGSVTSAHLARRRNPIQSRLALAPRGVEGFTPLAVRAGFTVTQSQDAVLSHQVELTWAG